MKVASSKVILNGLHPVMRKAMKVAEALWIEEGRPEGITVTCGLDGVHSASSWHYCGCAVDIRNKYWPDSKKASVHKELQKRLPDYDIVLHKTHVHMEPSDKLAKQWGLL